MEPTQHKPIPSDAIFGSNIVRIRTGVLDHSHVKAVINTFVNSIQQAAVDRESGLYDILAPYIDQIVTCDFEVNVVTKVDGTKKGISFVWFSSPAMYHIVRGKNPDGSRSEQEVPDPAYPGMTLEALIAEIGFNPHTMILQGSADQRSQPATPGADALFVKTYGRPFDPEMWLDPEDEKFRQFLLDKMKPRTMMERVILAELDNVALNPAQYAQNCVAHRAFYGPDAVCPIVHEFEVEGAYVIPNTDPRFKMNVLRATRAPLFVTQEMIHALFDKFNTDHTPYSFTLAMPDGTTQEVMMPYPIVKISVSKLDPTYKNVLVEFSPHAAHTQDASFARYMRWQARITNPANPSDSANLIFNPLELPGGIRPPRAPTTSADSHFGVTMEPAREAVLTVPVAPIPAISSRGGGRGSRGIPSGRGGGAAPQFRRR